MKKKEIKTWGQIGSTTFMVVGALLFVLNAINYELNWLSWTGLILFAWGGGGLAYFTVTKKKKGAGEIVLLSTIALIAFMAVFFFFLDYIQINRESVEFYTPMPSLGVPIKSIQTIAFPSRFYPECDGQKIIDFIAERTTNEKRYKNQIIKIYCDPRTTPLFSPLEEETADICFCSIYYRGFNLII